VAPPCEWFQNRKEPQTGHLFSRNPGQNGQSQNGQNRFRIRTNAKYYLNNYILVYYIQNWEKPEIKIDFDHLDYY